MGRLEPERGVERLEGAGVVADLPGRKAEHVVTPGVVGVALGVRLEHAGGLLVAAAVKGALGVGVARVAVVTTTEPVFPVVEDEGDTGVSAPVVAGVASAVEPALVVRSEVEQPTAERMESTETMELSCVTRRGMDSSSGVAPGRGWTAGTRRKAIGRPRGGQSESSV